MNRKTLMVLACATLLAGSAAAADSPLVFDGYQNPASVEAALRAVTTAHPGITKLHRLAESPGKRSVWLLEIGPETGSAARKFPAVFVAANLDGGIPLATMAALDLARRVIDKADVRRDKTWYVLACGNPDAAAAFFTKPLRRDPRNANPHNDDMDDAVDEDGPDDLNKDGLITVMRTAHPEGEWIPVPGEPLLMKKADPVKGEKGIYKLYPEGLDNDRDGEINEDGPGGVNIGVNFPHLFKFHTRDAGPWAGCEEESFNLIKFVNDHREIGLVLTFGDVNFGLTPPRGGRQGSADLTKIKIPERYGEMLGIDISRTYTIEEIKEMMQPFVPQGMELTDAMIASFLGLGAVVNPLPEDLKFYGELSEEFKEFLKQSKLDGKRLDPAAARDGSFELWAYYHMGLPSFAMDFWTLPEVKEEKTDEAALTPDDLEKMSNEEFIALGEEKIDAFLKASGAPAQFKAAQVIQALKGGMMDTKRMAQMMKQMPKPASKEGADPKDKALLAFSREKLDGKGIREWTVYHHPTLGEVEIGGAAPFADNTPPADMIPSLLDGQVPWVFELAAKMARIQIAKVEAKSLGAGLYRVEAWVENSGTLPYPIAMGRRNNRIPPVILTLEGNGLTFIEGKSRGRIPAIDGHDTAKVSWLIRAEKTVKLKLSAATEAAWSDTAVIDLGDAK